MSDPAIPEFECDQCGKRFRWKPDLAGKRVRCTCGSIMTCPAQPPEWDALYDLQPEAPAPQAPTPAKVALAYRAPKEDLAARNDPETIKNFYMPMWLLAGGIVIELIAAVFSRHSVAALSGIGVDVILGTALMLAGLLIAAKFRQIDLGSFWTTAFKLSAISVAPAAVVLLITPILNVLPVIPLGSSPLLSLPLGALLGLGVQFLLYFALLGALFDLDESDTWYCVWVIFLVRLAVYFLWMGLGRWQ
jgi:hypothetical protein